jgi:single-stranded DNA-binding protein
MTIECAMFGILTKDVAVKIDKNRKPYLRFSVRDGSGDTAQFVSVLDFESDAEGLAPKLMKGARVYVEGSIRLGTWDDHDGKQRTGLTIVSSYSRPAEIGQLRPKRKRKRRTRDQSSTDVASGGETDFYPYPVSY